jgi:hypothetical protein
MPTEQKILYCYDCEVQTLHIQKTPNHLLHLILVIITGGFWLLIWIFQSKGTPQCTQCGNLNKESKSNSLFSWIALILLVIVVISITNQKENNKPISSLKTQANTIKNPKSTAKFPKSVSEYCSLLQSINLKTLPIEKLKEGGYACLPIKRQLGTNKPANLSYYVYSKDKNNVNQLNFILNIGGEGQDSEAIKELSNAVNTLFAKLGVLSNNNIPNLIVSEENISIANGPYNITFSKKAWDDKKNYSIYISVQ